MVCQRRRSLIAWLQPVLAKVRCRISESSTLCVGHHSPRASQPQHTSELLEQQRLLAGRIADDLQGRGIPPLHSLTRLLGWDQTGNKDTTSIQHFAEAQAQPPPIHTLPHLTTSNSHPSRFYLLEKKALKFCSKSTSEPGTK